MAIEQISRDAAHGVALLAKSLEIALGQLELSPSQYRLLLFLADAPSAATALAQRLDVTRPSLTALVDGLVQRGLVVRTPDPDDRRRVTHQISDAGLAVVDQANIAIQTRLGAVLAHLPEREQRIANDGLEHWRNAVIAARAGKATA